MSPIGILIYTLIVIPFIWFIFTAGRRIFRIRSYKALLDDYRKQPKKYGIFEGYFLGFAIFNGKVTEWMIEILSDRVATIWYRISGVIFIIFSVLFTIGLIGIWAIYLINL